MEVLRPSGGGIGRARDGSGVRVAVVEAEHLEAAVPQSGFHPGEVLRCDPPTPGVRGAVYQRASGEDSEVAVGTVAGQDGAGFPGVGPLDPTLQSGKETGRTPRTGGRRWCFHSH